MLKTSTRLRQAISGAVIVGCASVLLWLFFSKPKSVPEESIELSNAIFKLDMGTIENHFFESEKEEYKLDDEKRNALKKIIQRGLTGISIVGLHSPEFQKPVGSGAIYIKFKCEKTQKVYDAVMPSYLTPKGVRTALMDVLLFVWRAQMYNDKGEGDKGIPDLAEAVEFGLALDANNLQQAGFKRISQDGLSFVTFQQMQSNVAKIRKMFEEKRERLSNAQ